MPRWHQEPVWKERRIFGADSSPAKDSHECEQACHDGVFGSSTVSFLLPTWTARRLSRWPSMRARQHDACNSFSKPRRVKLLSPTANAQADAGCGIFAIGPFRRLTARLPGPKLCLSPQSHWVHHELRPPALATPARHPGRLEQSSATRSHRIPPHREPDPQRKTRQAPDSANRRSASAAGRQRQSPRP